MSESYEFSFVFDTSAFISLEIIDLLNLILKNFTVFTSKSVISEMNDFSIYEDSLGKAAQKVINNKEIDVETVKIVEKLPHVSKTDNDIFNLALFKKVPLITDDIKLRRHAEDFIQIEFSTYFLLLFVEAELLTKQEALNNLESMKLLRNWQENIIYISTKEELTK